MSRSQNPARSLAQNPPDQGPNVVPAVVRLPIDGGIDAAGVGLEVGDKARGVIDDPPGQLGRLSAGASRSGRSPGP